MSSGLTNCFGFQTAVQGGDTVANSVAATIFASTVSLPATWLNVIGRTVRVLAWGIYSTDAGGHAITIDLMAGSTVLATTGSITPSLAGAVNREWDLEADITCRVIGATGTVEVHGKVTLQNATLVQDVARLPNTAPVTLDLTIAQALGIRITWGTASANNSITQRIFYPERRLSS